ncbi:MAG: heparinase II/III-family protein, partial [Gemmatimonadota bacterium]|nr:heparinase II/III-family protein [Gemmatimonadota bacterium]
YERSAMYHSQILSDLLDLREVAEQRGLRLHWLEDAIDRMGRFLVGITQPDGEIPLFNDAVIGQAPTPGDLLRRTQAKAPSGPVFDAADYGLTVVRGVPGEALTFDTGPLGPAHQPGHAHSDTLSFELTVGGARAVVNAGMDGYQSPRRPFFRSAAAHNTVRVDGVGPDELWSSFRVGGRSTPLRRAVRHEAEAFILEGSLRAFSGWRHARKLVYLPGRALLVMDFVQAAQPVEVIARLGLVGSAVSVVPLVGLRWEGVGVYSPRFNQVSELSQAGVMGTGSAVQLAMLLLWGEGSRVLPEAEKAGIRLSSSGYENLYAWPRP